MRGSVTANKQVLDLHLAPRERGEVDLAPHPNPLPEGHPATLASRGPRCGEREKKRRVERQCRRPRGGVQKLYRGTAAAFVLLVACSSGAHAADPIKVGVVTPLSGTYAAIGKQVRWGAELAVKEINAAGGAGGRTFDLLFEDEEANPPVAVRKAEKLLQQDKVDLLTGTVNS